MNIRNAAPGDEDAVVGLWHVCGLTVPHNNPVEDFRFALGKPASDILVAENDGIAGAVMVGHDGHRGWLYYIAVHPARRKQGIGRELVSAAERWLQQRGVAKVQLMVRETNAEVAAFYRRIGYDFMPRINLHKSLKP